VPVFGSTAIAARVERAECSLLAGGASAARSRDASLRAFAEPLAGGLAVWSGDGSPLNKVAGLGFEGEPDEDSLEAIEAAYCDRGSPVRFELANLADPAIGRRLTARGYVLAGFENVLGLPLAGLDRFEIARGVEVSRPGEDEEAVWLDCVVDGFASPDLEGVPSDETFPRDVLAAVIRDLTAGGGFIRYLARFEGEPAGGGSLRIAEGERIAQLAGAATLPPFRRRGIQSSLLAARLADARAAGCDFAVVTTQPGSKSQQNVQRQGFELLYTRAILVKETG
jgi:GNAT superfamily N-acetyltransferase